MIDAPTKMRANTLTSGLVGRTGGPDYARGHRPCHVLPRGQPSMTQALGAMGRFRLPRFCPVRVTPCRVWLMQSGRAAGSTLPGPTHSQPHPAWRRGGGRDHSCRPRRARARHSARRSPGPRHLETSSPLKRLPHHLSAPPSRASSPSVPWSDGPAGALRYVDSGWTGVCRAVRRLDAGMHPRAAILKEGASNMGTLLIVVLLVLLLGGGGWGYSRWRQ